MVSQRKKNLEVRYLSELKEVLLDWERLKALKDFPVYYILRGVKEKGDLRYDITIIPPNVLGREFVKTKGHYHLGNYGEIYQVLKGEGIFLMQKGKDKIEKVFFVKAKKGDWVKIPPGFAHATINASREILKIGNWISKKVKSDYLPIEKKHGMCYYLTVYGWEKNKNYQKAPPLKKKRAIKSFPQNINFLLGK